MSTADWSWILFSEETAERARLLFGMQINEFGPRSPPLSFGPVSDEPAREHLNPAGAAACCYKHARSGFLRLSLVHVDPERTEVGRYFDRSFGLGSRASGAEPSAAPTGYPLSWRGSLVAADWTVAVASWFARDPSIRDPVLSFFWNAAGSYILVGNAILATVNALRSSIRSVRSATPTGSLDPALAEVLQRVGQFGTRLVNILIVLLAAFFVRYSIGGIAALFSEPLSWIELGRLLGSGLSLRLRILARVSVPRTKSTHRPSSAA